MTTQQNEKRTTYTESDLKAAEECGMRKQAKSDAQERIIKWLVIAMVGGVIGAVEGGFTGFWVGFLIANIVASIWTLGF